MNQLINRIKHPPSFHFDSVQLKGQIESHRAPQIAFAHHLQGVLARLVHKQRVQTIERKKSEARVQLRTAWTQQELTGDRWGFGWLWHRIALEFDTVEDLYRAMAERREEIAAVKEGWRGFIEARKGEPLYGALKAMGAETAAGAYRIEDARFTQAERGCSGNYFLADAEGAPRFVVKPIDEDIGGLNNGRGHASPFTMNPFRDEIPLYLSSMREVLAYHVAREIGALQIVPKTALAILESDAFHDQFDDVAVGERLRYERYVGPLVREKLCSVQEFVPNAKTLAEGLEDLQQAGLSEAEIAARFDPRDFEDANLLLWTIFDADGHLNNFLVYPKSVDAIGNEILGIKKIDNGLAFSDKNVYLRNNLRYMPNASQTLSAEGRAKIAAISIDRIAAQMEEYGLGSAVPAMRERLAVLKQLAERPGLTLRDIDSRLRLLNKSVESALQNEIESTG